MRSPCRPIPDSCLATTLKPHPMVGLAQSEPDSWDSDISEEDLPRSLARLRVGANHKSRVSVRYMSFLK